MILVPWLIAALAAAWAMIQELRYRSARRDLEAVETALLGANRARDVLRQELLNAYDALARTSDPAAVRDRLQEFFADGKGDDA